MSCSNGCNAPMSGGSRRVQVGDRRKKNNKSRRVSKGGFWPFSSEGETSSSSLASGLSQPEKKGWLSGWFGSSDSASSSSSSSLPSSSSYAPRYSFTSQSGGRKKSRSSSHKRRNKSRRHRRRH